jgi:hypothetical protein
VRGGESYYHERISNLGGKSEEEGSFRLQELQVSARSKTRKKSISKYFAVQQQKTSLLKQR